MIAIDGQNIRTTWALTPVNDTFYSILMKDAGMKDRIIGDYSDANGLKVQTSEGLTKSQELTLSFICNSFAMYWDFLTYCVTQKVVGMFVSELDETISLEYMSCTAFNDYRDFNVFSVKFREANPTLRPGYFLLTESGLNLLTESDLYISI